MEGKVEGKCKAAGGSGAYEGAPATTSGSDEMEAQVDEAGIKRAEGDLVSLERSTAVSGRGKEVTGKAKVIWYGRGMERKAPPTTQQTLASGTHQPLHILLPHTDTQVGSRV